MPLTCADLRSHSRRYTFTRGRVTRILRRCSKRDKVEIPRCRKRDVPVAASRASLMHFSAYAGAADARRAC